MEDDNESEQATGSPSSGENEFVHIESLDSAQMDSASIDQVEHLEQDDGVVVTGVDIVQSDLPDVKTHDDAGPDEFVDCPDNLASGEGRSPGTGTRARQQPFGVDTEDIQFKTPQFDKGKEIIPHDYEEERKEVVKEVSDLYHQLKVLSNQDLTSDGVFSSDQHESETKEGGEKSNLPLHEMVIECSKFIELSLNKQSQAEATIRELYASLHMKDKEIEDLMVKVNEQSISHDEVKLGYDGMSSDIADRILTSLAVTFGEVELADTSVSGKLYYLENSTAFLLEKYKYFLSEVEMLGHCLTEVNSSFNMQNGMEMVFPSVRDELVELKRKEIEFNDKTSQLEYQLDKNRETIELMNSEIEKLKVEAEQEKTRYNNTKEKLSMAVTKGKALVQQRDSLKQLVTEKTSELERCLIELQEKSTALEAAESRNSELTQVQIFANSLQEALQQRDMVIEKSIETITLGLPETTEFPNFESRVSWLVESYNLAKVQLVNLQDENNAINEATRAEIDRLTAALLEETQEKDHYKKELEEITCKYDRIQEVCTESFPIDKEKLEKIQTLLYVCGLESKLYEQILDLEVDNRSRASEELRVLKDERDSLQINLQRSEEKASLLREKLSMAVKKGKGLVQERENMKQQMAEKNAQIEALMIDFQKQESLLGGCREQIPKLESERDQIGQFLAQSNNILQEVVETVDSININFPVDVNEPIEKVKFFTMYLNECQVAKAQVEQELKDVKDEAGQLAIKLTEALSSMKSLEDALSVYEKHFSELSEEKIKLEVSKNQAEQDLEIIKEEMDTLNNKLVETLKTLKLLEDKLSGSEERVSQLESAKCHVEDALSVAEKNIALIAGEKEEVQLEIEKYKQEVSVHVSNLDEAKKTIMSLEDAMTQLKTNVTQFSHENEKAVDIRNVLESEIKKLKEDAELEISTLKIELSTCRQELAAKNDKGAPDLSGFNGNLAVFIKDESLLSLFKQSFNKKIESLKEINGIVKDMRDNLDSEQLHDLPTIEETFQLPEDNDAWNPGLIDVEFDAEDTDGFNSYVGQTLRSLTTKNRILSDQFGSFSTHVDDIIASLLKNLDAIRNSMPSMVQQTKTLQQNVNNMQMDNQILNGRVVMLEHDIKVLVSACADVTKGLKFLFDNNILQTDPTNELEKLSPIVIDEVTGSDVKDAANELHFASRSVRSLIEQHVSEKENMSATIERLQSELETASSTYNKSKEVIEDLQVELDKTRLMYEKVEEQNDAFQRKVFELETELEASGNTCNEISSQLEEYRAKEDELNEIKQQLSAQSISSVKDRGEEAANARLSGSQIEALFDKIDGITIPFPNLVGGDIQPEHSDPVKKLFYIVDNVNELLDQLILVTNAEEDLRSTISKQSKEVDRLKGEYKDGLQNIIQKLGGDEFVGVKKPADVAGLLSVLERLVQDIVMDHEKSRFKLVETQKIADELSSKVKLLEEYNQNRTGGPDTIQERGVFEAPSLPVGSEISEIDDQVPVGKMGLPLVASAAQMRSLRKGSNDQLAITIDSESDRLLDKSKTVEDKGHIFKSLHTSGLVPVQGKMIADRLDGIWVSGGQALMRQPRARLGLIAYWLVLHLWLLGTIL